MPAGDDEIYRSLRFNRNEVDFSQWPKLSCSAANELTLATQDDPNPGFARLAIAGELKLQIGVAVNELSSDEKLTNNSDLAIPTQKAVKTYVDNQIAVINQTLSTKAALNGASSQDFQSKNLSVSGNLTANGNVSIGTTSSSYKLAIAAGDINIDDGHVLRQAGRWVIGGDSKILSIGSSNKSDGRDISFDPGFSGALTIKKDTGNVGIGTTSPTNKLHVVGASPVTIENAGEADILFKDTSNGQAWQVGTNATGWYVYDTDYRLVVNKGSGNVGIGTTQPRAKLEIVANSTTWSGWYEAIRLGQNAHSAITHPGGNLLFGLHSDRRFYFADMAEGQYIMTIDANPAGGGNVGIGTTAPGSKLDVRGNLFVQAEVRADGGFQVDGQTVIDSDAGWHRSYGNTGWYNGTHGGGWYMEDSTWIRSYGGKNIYQDRGILRTDGTLQVGSNGDRFIVNTSGNVGIGTTSPGAKLDISGGDVRWGNNSRLQGDQGGSIELGGDRSTPGRGTPYIDFHFAGLTQDFNTRIINDANGRLTLVADEVFLTGRLRENSSRQIKEKIENLTIMEAFKALKDLNPVKFKFRADSSNQIHLGFIAEDVPTLVATADRKGICISDIVALLTKVVKEQQNTISVLAEKIKALDEKQN